MLVFGIACLIGRRPLVSWVVGTLPGLLVLGWFKFRLAPASDLAQPIAAFMGKLLDPSRHVAVVQALPVSVMLWWALPLALLAYQLAGVRKSPDARIAVWTAIVMLAGYYVVYVTTPHPQAWHVGTPLNRLLVQVWPLAVMALVAHDGRSQNIASDSRLDSLR